MWALGKQPPRPYYVKPSAKAQRLQEQLGQYPDARAVDIGGELNEAAQQKLISTEQRLIGVNAPEWLRLKAATTTAISPRAVSPRPKSEKLD